ncbi:MAG: hypothetical protein ACXV49_10380, partial [Halobacteriota archaeon]
SVSTAIRGPTSRGLTRTERSMCTHLPREGGQRWRAAGRDHLGITARNALQRRPHVLLFG